MDFLTDIFSGPMGLNLFGLGSATAGAGSIFSDMSVPGLPTVTPPNGLGLLRAGDDDMRPPPLPGGTGNLGLSQAGGEGLGLGTSRDVTATGSTTPPIAAANPPPITLPPPTGPTTSIPVPPTGVGAGLRPVESTAPTPPGGAPPKIDISKPSAGGTAVPAQAAPPAPSTTTTGTTEASPTALQTIKDALSKMPNLQAAQSKMQAASIGGMQGDPAAASRQGASQLFQSIMDEHAKRAPPPRGVPQLPPSLLKRFPQMGM